MVSIVASNENQKSKQISITMDLFFDNNDLFVFFVMERDVCGFHMALGSNTFNSAIISRISAYSVGSLWISEPLNMGEKNICLG